MSDQEMLELAGVAYELAHEAPWNDAIPLMREYWIRIVKAVLAKEKEILERQRPMTDLFLLAQEERAAAKIEIVAAPTFRRVPAPLTAREKEENAQALADLVMEFPLTELLTLGVPAPHQDPTAWDEPAKVEGYPLPLQVDAAPTTEWDKMVSKTLEEFAPTPEEIAREIEGRMARHREDMRRIREATNGKIEAAPDVAVDFQEKVDVIVDAFEAGDFDPEPRQGASAHPEQVCSDTVDLQTILAKAVAEEREACARICDGLAPKESPAAYYGGLFAREIRKRGQ